MRLSTAIQHHPRRADLLPALLAGLDHAEVVIDPDPANSFPSPWRTYRHALEMTPAWATHRLILQDDIEVCRDFVPTVKRAIWSRPDRLLAFFVAGRFIGDRPVEHCLSIFQGCERDDSWVQLDNTRWCPAVALAWPVELIAECLAFVDEQRWPIQFRADDEIIGRYLRAAGKRALASVPSLVEHPDLVPSLVSKRNANGHDPNRVAACMIHPDCDPSLIDWDRGPA